MKKFIYLLMLALFFVTACSSKTEPTPAQIDANSNVKELQIIDLKVGDGHEARTNFRVAVHYTGWLYDENAEDHKGKKFDSSFDRKRPFVFSLGNKDVIAGWDKGIVGMKMGGKRRLIIPPHMAYGAKGFPPVIPPNAALVFDIELLQAG